MWGCVHIAFLIGFRNRLIVLLSWFSNWLLNAPDARLITGNARLDIHIPRPAGFVPCTMADAEDRSAPKPTASHLKSTQTHSIKLSSDAHAAD